MRTWWGSGFLAPARRPWAIDGLVALVLCTITSVDLAVHVPEPGQASGDLWGYVLVAAMSLPFVVHRPLPTLALCVVLGAVLLYSLGQYAAYPGLNAFALLFGLAAHHGRRRSTVALAATLGVMLVALTQQPPEVADQSTWISTVLATFVAWLTGLNLRSRRARWAVLEERARMLEREREERARQAVTEERLRIARELHDVIAHSMSVIAVQAGVGHHVIDTQPDEARHALGVIETTSRTALTEMRQLLGVLRQDGDAGGELLPAPGLESVPQLVDQIAEAGVDATVSVDGDRVDLPTGVDLSAYRIVQEALTNVIKHGGQHASVTITYRTDEVHVEVTDDGAVPPRGQHLVDPGHGLIGMRERVAVFNGRLTAGPRPGGGFRVSAHLPFTGAQP